MTIELVAIVKTEGGLSSSVLYDKADNLRKFICISEIHISLCEGMIQYHLPYIFMSLEDFSEGSLENLRDKFKTHIEKSILICGGKYQLVSVEIRDVGDTI